MAHSYNFEALESSNEKFQGFYTKRLGTACHAPVTRRGAPDTTKIAPGTGHSAPCEGTAYPVSQVLAMNFDRHGPFERSTLTINNYTNKEIIINYLIRPFPTVHLVFFMYLTAKNNKTTSV
jgi:hypothetical protein